MKMDGFDSNTGGIKHRHGALQDMDPACVRKLVEDAQAYAKDLGFDPHADYHLSRQIFGDVDQEACSMSFQFGKDGKPFYISGPYDDPRPVICTLERTAGRGNFEFLAVAG